MTNVWRYQRGRQYNGQQKKGETIYTKHYTENYRSCNMIPLTSEELTLDYYIDNTMLLWLLFCRRTLYSLDKVLVILTVDLQIRLFSQDRPTDVAVSTTLSLWQSCIFSVSFYSDSVLYFLCSSLFWQCGIFFVFLSTLTVCYVFCVPLYSDSVVYFLCSFLLWQCSIFFVFLFILTVWYFFVFLFILTVWHICCIPFLFWQCGIFLVFLFILTVCYIFVFLFILTVWYIFLRSSLFWQCAIFFVFLFILTLCYIFVFLFILTVW
jgi:hypothetical protein